MKNPMIPAGIEPAAFRFVAQHLKHCATAGCETVATQSTISIGVSQKLTAEHQIFMCNVNASLTHNAK